MSEKSFEEQVKQIPHNANPRDVVSEWDSGAAWRDGVICATSLAVDEAKKADAEIAELEEQVQMLTEERDKLKCRVEHLEENGEDVFRDAATRALDRTDPGRKWLAEHKSLVEENTALKEVVKNVRGLIELLRRYSKEAVIESDRSLLKLCIEWFEEILPPVKNKGKQ